MVFYDPMTKIYHGLKVPEIYHPNASLGQVLLHKFHHRPHKVIQVSDDDGVSVTCGEMAEMMTNVAKNLSTLGLTFGDVVGLYATNTTYVAPTMFACYLTGLPMSPIDVSFNVDQIVQIYRQTKPKIVFCDHLVVEKLISALDILEIETRVVVLTEKVEGLLHISDLIKTPNEPVSL
jgi:long-subunit acyl-CoA synthetase (AMP-forming)